MKAKILYASVLGLVGLLTYAVPSARAGWGGTPFSCGSGDATLKIAWQSPSDVGKAVLTEDSSAESDSGAPYGITDIEAHMKNLPALRYNFRNPIVNPMNPNYKFSRRIEMSVFGRKGVREFIDRNFRPEKAQMTEEDLGTPDTQANIVFYTYSGVQMYKLTTRGKDMKKLKPAPFTSVMKGMVKKHQKLLRDEVKEFKAWEKAQEEKAEAED